MRPTGSEDGESFIFDYALDGFAIHSPLSDSAIELDECQGHTTEELGYHYHAGDLSNNAVLDCFSGAIVATEAGPAFPPGGGPKSASGPPDFSEAASTLGVSVEVLVTALGRPPFDLKPVAKTFGVDVVELEAVLLPPPQ